MIIGVITANLIMGIAFGVGFFRLPPQIPIYYSRPWGEDQLADLWFIVIIPILMNLFVFINRWIMNRYFSKRSFLVMLFTVFNWGMITIATATFIRIIILVTL